MNDQIYGAFDSVHAEYELKEHTKKYLAQNSVRSRRISTYCAAAAAVLLLLLAAGGGYGFYMTPVAVISIDINPSMEWEVNRLDRVVSVICYNEDAENVAQNLQFKYRKYDEAIDELLASREMSGYLSEDSTVSFSVASENAARSDRMQERAAECAGHYCENVSCHGGSTKERQEANEAGMSLGKYQAFQMLRESDPDITLEEVGRMHMCQIRRRIEGYQAGDEGGEEQQDICSEEGCQGGTSENNDGSSDRGQNDNGSSSRGQNDDGSSDYGQNDNGAGGHEHHHEHRHGHHQGNE